MVVLAKCVEKIEKEWQLYSGSALFAPKTWNFYGKPKGWLDRLRQHCLSCCAETLLWESPWITQGKIFHSNIKQFRVATVSNKIPWPKHCFLPSFPLLASDKWQMSRLITKPTKWHVCTAKTQISLGICPVSWVFTVCMKEVWVLSYPLSTQRRLTRLGGCPGWAESSLGASHFVLSWGGSNSLF